MGLRYLGGKSWAEISREERFFCQRLYVLACERGLKPFVEYLNGQVPILGAKPDANWEMGYEVCFYRDLWHHQGRPGDPFLQKRTFDLCCFSDDHIILLEAKAQQGFKMKQVADFVRDKERVAKETDARVSLLGLVSSRYQPSPSIRESFDGPLLTWQGLAPFFDHDPILVRADDLYGR